MNLKSKLIVLTAATFCLTACKQNSNTALKSPGLKDNADTLNLQVARNYVKNYAKNAGTIDSVFIDEGTTKIVKLPNTRAVWFSVERMKALVEKIEAEGGDGIRFYYATYDSVYDRTRKNPPPKSYWDHNTLIMVSTKDSLKYHRDYYNDRRVGHGNGKNGFIVGAFPENRGEMCPPPANCRSLGATLLIDRPEDAAPKGSKNVR